MDERDLGRQLASVVVPGELEARRRSWSVARAAFDAREPGTRPRTRWPIVALAGAAVLLAAAVTPPGLAVLGKVRDAVGRERVVGKAVQPSLFSLPTQGRLLVESTRGPWIVQPNGAKRLLGAYREASWSPFGHFVVAARQNELVAVEPGGRVRWSIARPDVKHPRWGGTLTDTRVAYLSGDALRVVAGDNTGDHVLVRTVADVAPAWKPNSDNVLAYVTPEGRTRLIDAGTGKVTGGWREGSPEQLVFSADGKLVAARSKHLLSIYTDQALRVTGITGATGKQGLGLGKDEFVDIAFAPTLPTLAYIMFNPETNQSTVWTIDRGGKGSEHKLFEGLGRMTALAWSPDGNWLLVAWASADQWVFIHPGTGDAAAKIVARSSITEQLSGSGSDASFPSVAGWCCSLR